MSSTKGFFKGRVYGVYSDTALEDDMAWERSTYYTAEEAIAEAAIVHAEYLGARRVWVEANREVGEAVFVIEVD
jgi:hypothetical protein